MVLEDLLRFPASHGQNAYPESNPIAEENALQEAQLLDLRFDALHSSAGLLFELRTAIQLQAANTGVLVANKLSEITWSAEERSTERTAWNVIGSAPSCVDGRFTLNLLMYPSARLRLIAKSAAFSVVDVLGLGDAPPDYSGDDERIRNGLATWNSYFEPVQMVFCDPEHPGL